MRCYPVSSKSKRYYLTLWEDRTELENTIQTMNSEETTVAYVMADNLEELAQYAKESTRAAANELENVLKEWLKAPVEYSRSIKAIAIFFFSELPK